MLKLWRLALQEVLCLLVFLVDELYISYFLLDALSLLGTHVHFLEVVPTSGSLKGESYSGSFWESLMPWRDSLLGVV